jgi:hypothetical protein
MPQFEDGAAPLTLPGTSGEVSGSFQGQYLGFAVRETSGSAAAHVVLFDNASAASGAILDEIGLAAGQSLTANYPRPGRKVVHGIFASITGAVEGSVFQ